MSTISSRARFEELRSLGFASISGTYTALGSALENPARLIKITNSTDQPVLVSTDGVTDHDIVPEMGFVLYDFGANRSNMSGSLDFSSGVRFFVKEDAASPTSGSVYLTVIYASNQ